VPAPLDALWRPTALMAVLLAGEALALVLALAPGTEGWVVRFGLASLGIQWIAVATLCALFLLRHPLARLPALKMAWACLGLLLAMTLLIATAAWELLGMTMDPGVGKASFVLRMLALAFVVGLLGLVTYQNYWRARQLAVRAKQLELEALQARIRPHFLFNTLNTGAALVHAAPGGGGAAAAGPRRPVPLPHLRGPQRDSAGRGTGAGAAAISRSKRCASASACACTGSIAGGHAATTR
jgi:two-component system sensor histidine kinase AlgZ